VKVELPATVAIVVEERQPVLAWVLDGREQWVDPEGFAFPPRGDPGKLVRVEAQNTPPVEVSEAMKNRLLEPKLVEGILAMAPIAPEGSPLVFDVDHGLGWTDERGWKVYFGMNTSDIDQKLLVYESLVDYLEKEGQHPSFISVEYVHAPYYRLEQ
jgi:cell division protein FtsQ